MAVRERAVVPRGANALPVAVPALIALLVHRRVLGLFFSPDDLVQLERTTGLVPQPPLPWRVLSLRVYEAAAYAAFGAEPFGWHAVALLVHAANAALVAVWALRLGASGPAALIAGSAFAATAVSVTTVSQMSTMGELLALALSLAALLAFDARANGRRAAGVVAHVGALLSKESVALVPLVAWLRPAAGEPRARPRWSVVLALAASCALWGVLMLARREAAAAFPLGEAYRFSIGGHIVANLITYAGWSTGLLAASAGDPPLPIAARVAGEIVGLALLAYALRSGSRAARSGLALWLLSLLPVLPLQFQVHAHYAYVGLAGCCVALGCAVVALVRRVAGAAASRRAPGGRNAWLAAALLALVCAAAGERGWIMRAGPRVAGLGLPLDSMLRKMEFAQNVYRDLRFSLPEGRSRLVIYAPPGSASTYGVRSGQRADAAGSSGPTYNMFDAVLDNGRALRALFPRLEDARLREHVDPADAGALVAGIQVDGHVKLFGAGLQAHAALAAYWRSVGLPAAADAHLAEALALEGPAR